MSFLPFIPALSILNTSTLADASTSSDTTAAAADSCSGVGSVG